MCASSTLKPVTKSRNKEARYDHGPTFPIGGLGDGSIVFIDLESGRVRGYNCDYADLEEIAENFSSLLLGLVEQALELGNLCKEL